MATSGHSIIRNTAGELIKRAFRLINVVGAGQDVPARDERDAIAVLNDMLQDWTTDGVTPWRREKGSITPIKGQSEYKFYGTRVNLIGAKGDFFYTSDSGHIEKNKVITADNTRGDFYYIGEGTAPVVDDPLLLEYRPIEIIEARWVAQGGCYVPMSELEHDEYYLLPNQAAEGTPTLFYYSRGREFDTLNVWPSPHVITTEKIEFTYSRRIETVVSATQELDVPQEWFLTVAYNLAALLADEYGSTGEITNRVIMRAQELYETIKGYEREGSIYFYPDYY